VLDLEILASPPVRRGGATLAFIGNAQLGSATLDWALRRAPIRPFGYWVPVNNLLNKGGAAGITAETARQ
jgi:hypothetical protein